MANTAETRKSKLSPAKSLAVMGLLISAVSTSPLVSGDHHSSEPKAGTKISAGPAGEVGDGLGVGTAVGACAAEPGPLTCGAAVGTGLSWADSHSNDPLQIPDQTEVGPMGYI